MPRRATTRHRASASCSALSYWFLMSVFVAVGKAGLLPPALAAWTPNIMVSACAVYLLLKAKT